IHVDGRIDPMRDLETINMELIFADMEVLERRMDRTRKAMRADKKYGAELAVFEKLMAALSEGNCARTVELTEDEEACLYDTPLLTRKPVIYVANVSEDCAAEEPVGNAAYDAVKAFAASEHSQIIPICCQIEAEIAELSAEEKQMFLADLGIEESGLDRLIKASYALLGLVSFLTAGADECRAWTIRKGTKAPRAAGKIHSDIERGFIRAEVLAFEDLKKHGSMSAAREAGVLRSEGKEYVMQDGDIVLFRFNV
ncbi:MAG: YchF family ATPase, partial [Clostridia bacterium]|nr:YchF family ATPase [Clostridia bacterium]